MYKVIKEYMLESKLCFGATVILIALTCAFQIGASLALVQLINSIIVTDINSFIFYLLLDILCWVISILANYLEELVSNKVLLKANLKVLSRYSRSVIKEDKHDLSKFINELKLIDEHVFTSVFNLILLYLNIGLSFLTLCYFNWFIAITAIVFYLLMTYLPNLFNNFLNKSVEKFKVANTDFTNGLLDQLNGLSVYKLFYKLDMYQSRVNQLSLKYENNKYVYKKNQALVDMILAYINLIGQFGNLIVAYILVIYGYVSTGVIFAVGNLSGMFYNSIGTLASVKADLNAHSSLLPTTNMVITSSESMNLNVSTISINDLSYSYNDKTISYPDYVFNSKDKYLISGVNGSGKSTLLKVLIGQLKGYHGELKINDKVYSYDDTSKPTIGYISNHDYLFNDSIMNNLCLDDHFDIEQIKHVIHICELDDLIADKGLDYVLEDNGSNVSAGQKMKLIIARCLLRHCSFLFVDEGLESLDTSSYANLKDLLLNKLEVGVILVDHHSNKDTYSGTVYSI